MSVLNSITMDCVKARYREGSKGGHWFDRDTMRFFHTVLPRIAYIHEDGRVFFVSRETNPSSTVAYSVREMAADGSRINTVGPFHAYTRQAANRIAKTLAMGGELKAEG